MKKLLTHTAAAWMACAAFVVPVSAGSPVVVELFTSQGCSSCPPADALLHDIADRDDVIALALHVDYWDYIGWKDDFANPAHAKRQRGYAIEGGRRTVYTPQMIINGTTDIVGARAMDLVEAIMNHAKAPSPVTLNIARSGETVQIRAQADGAQGPLMVHVVRYTPSREVNITRGENAGRSLTYANIVEDWETLGEWDGQGEFDSQAEASGDRPIVVIIQAGYHGPILAAARLR